MSLLHHELFRSNIILMMMMMMIIHSASATHHASVAISLAIVY